MWSHISLNAEVVWDDALWRFIAIWQDDDVSDAVTLEKSGRVPLRGDRHPEEILYLCAQAALDASRQGPEQIRFR